MVDERFEVSHAGPVTVVSIALPVSMDSAVFDRLNDQLDNVFGAAGGPDARFVLDLSGVAYMGSSALGLLVNVRQRVRQSGGQLVLCGLSPRMLEVFRTCCMEKLFRIVRTRSEAVAALKGSAA